MANNWNITATKMYIDEIKNSKYFDSTKLGRSLTVESSNVAQPRILRENTFTSWYYDNYKSLIFKSGEIGILHFYIDYYLKNNILGFFLSDDLENHQYAIEWQADYIKEVGIDSWLGEKLKEIDETIEFNKSEDKKEINTSTKGDAEKLKVSPGSTSWKDIEEYYHQKKNLK